MILADSGPSKCFKLGPLYGRPNPPQVSIFCRPSRTCCGSFQPALIQKIPVATDTWAIWPSVAFAGRRVGMFFCAARLIRVTLTLRKSDGTKSHQFSEEDVAGHPSVIKRQHQSLKRRKRNVETRSRIRTLIKKARELIDAKNQESASAQLRVVNKALDNAVSRGIIKRNTASRWMSRLSGSAWRATPAS